MFVVTDPRFGKEDARALLEKVGYCLLWSGRGMSSIPSKFPWSVPPVDMWELGSVRVGPRVQLRVLHASSQSLEKRRSIGNENTSPSSGRI